MGVVLHWFLPTNGDSRDIVGAGDRSQDTLAAITDFRAPTIDYLGQVARSAEQLGYMALGWAVASAFLGSAMGLLSGVQVMTILSGPQRVGAASTTSEW